MIEQSGQVMAMTPDEIGQYVGELVLIDVAEDYVGLQEIRAFPGKMLAPCLEHPAVQCRGLWAIECTKAPLACSNNA